MRARPSTWSTCTRILPPGSVNFTAFTSRFQNTCCRRSASPVTRMGPEGASWCRRTSRAEAAGVTASTASRTTPTTSIGCASSRSRPPPRRLRSSRSSINCVCRRALRAMVASPDCSASAVRGPDWRICAHPRMALSGVRSSCDTVPRNSSRRSMACSASWRAARSRFSRLSRSCSARRRSVTSIATPTRPVSVPSASKVAVQDSSMWTRRPSARANR